jgi:hypothetical protein
MIRRNRRFGMCVKQWSRQLSVVQPNHPVERTAHSVGSIPYEMLCLWAAAHRGVRLRGQPRALDLIRERCGFELERQEAR